MPSSDHGAPRWSNCSCTGYPSLCPTCTITPTPTIPATHETPDCYSPGGTPCTADCSLCPATHETDAFAEAMDLARLAINCLRGSGYPNTMHFVLEAARALDTLEREYTAAVEEHDALVWGAPPLINEANDRAERAEALVEIQGDAIVVYQRLLNAAAIALGHEAALLAKQTREAFEARLAALRTAQEAAKRIGVNLRKGAE